MNFQIKLGVLLWSLLATASVCNAEEFTLFVDSSNNVGVGTGSPQVKLHILDEEFAYNLPLTVENNSARRFSGFRLKIGPGDHIDFNNADGKFRINVDQVPGAEFEVRPNGDATLSGALTQNSDVNSKQDIVMVDHDEILAKVVKLPVSEWSYKDNPHTRHIGPMAQDFHATFGLGDSPTGISTIDTGGVALAAIQGLKQETDARVEQLAEENARLQAQIIQLEMAVTELLRNQSAEARVGFVN